MPPSSPSLAAFFEKAFNADELTLALAPLQQGLKALDAAGRNLPHPIFCLQVAQALERLNAIDDVLLARLLEKLPNREVEIRALWAAPLQQPKANAAPLALRFWDPGPPPLAPWPVLGPVRHPDLLGGRDADLQSLLEAVDQDPLLITVYALSGAGKSSLLMAGLLPALGNARRPAALVRQPNSIGLLHELARCIVQDQPTFAPDDLDGFLDLVDQVGLQAGAAPVLVLDQVEEVFLGEDTRARARLGQLLVATAERGNPCRWVLAYRHEFHGRVRFLLNDPLRWCEETRASPPPRLRGLEWPLPVLGDARGTADRLEHAVACFKDAMLKPLRTGHYPNVRLEEEEARRLAEAFGGAREGEGGDRDAPLTPELQVVLERLRQGAGPTRPQVLRVPVDPAEAAALLNDAIAAHIATSLAMVVDRLYADEPADTQRARRTDALLLLAQLVDEKGRRRAVPVDDLTQSVGAAGQALLRELRDERVWLVRVERLDHTDHATLPHDRVAAEVHRLITDPAAALARELDPEVLTLWRLVTSRTAAWKSHDPGAVVLDTDTVAKLRARWEALPRTAAMSDWWAAAQQSWARQERTRLTGVVRAAPIETGEPLRALHALRTDLGLDGAALAEVLRAGLSLDADRRDDILGTGPAWISEDERHAQISPLVVDLAPHVAGHPQPESFWGALLAAADSLGSPDRAADAHAAVVRAMRVARGDPPALDAEDGSWSPVIAGRFQVGGFPEDEDVQRDETLHPVVLSPYRLARAAVSVAEYRSFSRSYFASEKDDWLDNLPAFRLGWWEARAYAAWRGATLPTEHQWEVACRGGGVDGAYARGASAFGDLASLERCAVLLTTRKHLAGGDHPAKVTQPIPGAPAHPLGLHHIHGNVFEWCQDWFAAYPEDAGADPAAFGVTPAPATPSAMRVLRGGSWLNPAAFARSAYRDRNRPSLRDNDVGFRLALPQPVDAGT